MKKFHMFRVVHHHNFYDGIAPSKEHPNHISVDIWHQTNWIMVY